LHQLQAWIRLKVNSPAPLFTFWFPRRLNADSARNLLANLLALRRKWKAHKRGAILVPIGGSEPTEARSRGMNRIALLKRVSWATALAAICSIATSRELQAQVVGGFQQAVGGVSIDADGALKNAERDALKQLAQLRQRALAEAPGDLKQPAELRKVSLRRLEQAIGECLREGKPLGDEIRFLAGLQRIRYIFVYPEQNDIVLAGYGEGWTVNSQGFVVGSTTGRPVLLLDDLLVALRSARQAARGGITCSIDPTAEGLRDLQAFLGTLPGLGEKPATLETIERKLGMQTITVNGVPAESHFARVLVAADYRMKRLGMNFEPAPVPGLPSYLTMIKGKSAGQQNMLPRWWLATNYDPLLTDADGLAWELRGQGVKGMAEDDFLAADGTRQHSGKASPAAKRWADNLTARYEELSGKSPIFAQLRNCMDLAVVSALVFKEHLAEKAGLALGLMLDDVDLPGEKYFVPKQVASKASVVETRSSYIISVSGGVAIDSWQVADKKETSAELAPARTAAKPGEAGRWWWN